MNLCFYKYMNSTSHFPRAADYPPFNRPAGARLAEEADPFDPAPPRERHLHCLWQDDRLRPDGLVTANGEPVRVLHPGRWNAGPGPDFTGTVIEVGRPARRLECDTEIHIDPAGWRQHGHLADPRYARVFLHVCWYDAPLAASELPPGCLQVALQPVMAARRGFHFDQIDPTAYPYEVQGPLHPLRELIHAMAPDEREKFLAAAGEERLRRKAVALEKRIARVGPEQALYEQVLRSLGYRDNRAPFQQLAQRLPVGDLRELSALDPAVAYALLLGVSGLIPIDAGEADREGRAFVRELWDTWWRHSERLRARTLPREIWRMSQLRPANHPVRRMMAAAHLFTQDEPLGARLFGKPREPHAWLAHAASLLQVNTQTFWTRRLGLEGAEAERPVAILGKPRIAAMLVNVFVPFAAATDRGELFTAGVLEELPREPVNSLMRQTAHALFGPDHPPSLYRDTLRRQGLMQVFYDYALGLKE